MEIGCSPGSGYESPFPLSRCGCSLAQPEASISGRIKENMKSLFDIYEKFRTIAGGQARYGKEGIT